MIYDEGNKKWMPSGSTQGLSKIHIYQHSVNKTFRVVGRKLQDHEVGPAGGSPYCSLGNAILAVPFNPLTGE